MAESKAKELGQFIQRQREAKGLSIRGLARETGLPPATVYRIEQGEFEQPAPEKLQRLARALEADVEDLYALAGYMMPEGLPDFAPYLRAKFALPDRAVNELDAYFRLLQEKYGDEEGERHA